MVHRIRFSLLSLCLCSLPAPRAVAEPLTPEAVTRLVLENNPGLAAARALVAEAEARASGLGRLPNPEFESEFAAASRERGRIELGLSQRFPRSSRLRLERRVAAESIHLARLEIAVRAAETVAEAREALLDLAHAEAAAELAEKQAALAAESAESQRAQSAQGQASALDAAQARLAAREAALAVATAHAETEAARARLSTLLGREVPNDAAVETADPLRADLDLGLPASLADASAVSSAPMATPLRPDLALAEAGHAALDTELALARSTGREDFSLGLFVEGEQDRDELGDRERELMIGLRFSIPLPVRDVAAPAVAEKQAARRRLALEREALAQAARNEVAATAAALRARFAHARDLAAELLPAARDHLAATEAAARRGEADPAQTFRARERLFALERADLDARHAFHLALVRHLAASGALAVSVQ